MKKLLNYWIIKEIELIIEVLVGEIRLEDYLRLKETTTRDKQYDPNYRHIVDFREANLMPEGNNIKQEIMNYTLSARTIPNLLGRRKSAVITATPKEVALMTLFKLYKDIQVEVEVFSTLAAAILWLDLKNVESNKIENIISQIKGK